MQQLRRSEVSQVRGEKVVAARTENIHTLTHTQDDCYTLAANAYARVTSDLVRLCQYNTEFSSSAEAPTMIILNNFSSKTGEAIKLK